MALKEYTRSNRLLNALKGHHRRIKEAFASLQRHMSIKKQSMNFVLERWRREFINIKSCEEDFRIIVPEELDFSMKDSLYLLTEEYMNKITSLYIDLEMVKFMISKKRSVLMTAAFSNQQSKQQTIIPALVNLETQLKNRPEYQDLGSAQVLEGSRLLCDQNFWYSTRC